MAGTAVGELSPEEGPIRGRKLMRFSKKRRGNMGLEETIGAAKHEFRLYDDKVSELKGALKGLHRLDEITEFVKGTDWKQRCTLLFELIYQHFDGQRTAEELIRHDVIDYVAVEVTEDFKEVFQAIQAKYPGMGLNGSLHGYLIHVQKLIKEETGFGYPDEILHIAGTMIMGKFRGSVERLTSF
jgi:hypothetical protein